MPATTAPLDRPIRRSRVLGAQASPLRSAQAMRRRTLVLLLAVVALVVALHPAAAHALPCYQLAKKSCIGFYDDGYLSASVQDWCTLIRWALCAIGY